LNFSESARPASGDFLRRQVWPKPDWLFLNKLDKSTLGHFLSQPIAKMDVFPDFPALVPMFSLFSGLMLRFAEWIFRVANRLTDDFECLHHSFILSRKLAA
jgi:hypothetical protein